MSLKIKTLISGIVTIIILLSLYFSFRMKELDKIYTENLIQSSNYILNSYKKLNKDADSIEIAHFFNKIHGKLKNIALIAVSDNDLNIKLVKENKKYIRSKKLLNIIISNFKDKEFDLQWDKHFITKHFNYQINNRNVRDNFFIMNKKVINSEVQSRLLILFPYKFSGKIIVKIILELLLIILITVIITTLLFIIIKKKNSTIEEKPAPAFPTNKIAEDYEKKNDTPLESLKPLAELEDSNISEIATGIASDQLNTYIYELFKNLYNKFSPESISIYIRNSPDTLTKSYILKGKSFIKIDSDYFEVINLNNDIGNELKNDTVMIMNNNEKMVLPIINNDSLIGIIELLKKSCFSGNEITEIKNELESIKSEISKYIVVNNVMVDRETGIYSKTYFQLKYNELTHLALKADKLFSLIFISLVSENNTPENKPISKDHLNLLIKTISPGIVELLKDDDQLCLYDDYLGIILPDVDKNSAIKLTEEILNLLTKYRIKIDKNTIIQISAIAGISSTEDTEKSELVQSALNSLKEAGE